MDKISTSPVTSSKEQATGQVPVFHGKCIYNPNGKATEYSEWTVNYYNGCTHNCSYCYNNHSLMSATVGGTTVRLKKQLVDETTAYKIFQSKLLKY